MSINWETILVNAGIQMMALDVGCSNGRPYQWNQFGSALRYIGIDPLKNEILRLRSLNHSKSEYISGFLGIDAAKGYADEETSKFFSRSSAWQEMTNGYNQQEQISNSGFEILIDEQKFSAKELVNKFDERYLDLLKIDIDGDDFLAMKSFFDIGMGDKLLLLDIESQFHGNADESGNTIWNIGKLANQHGLYLYDLSLNRYSRSILPSNFIYHFPAQTRFGQVLWGDSLFLRDSLDERLDLQQLTKLIAIYEVYGLYDCALEAMNNHLEFLSPLIPTNEIWKSLIRNHETRERKTDKELDKKVWLSQKWKKLFRW